MNDNNSLLFFIEDFIHYCYYNIIKIIPEELYEEVIANCEERKYYQKSCALGLTIFHTYAKDYFDDIDSLYRLMINLCLARERVYPYKTVLEYFRERELSKLEQDITLHFKKNGDFYRKDGFVSNNEISMQNAFIINTFLQYSRILKNTSYKDLEGQRFLIDNLDNAVFFDLTGESILLYENCSLWNSLSDYLCNGLMSIAEGNVYTKKLLKEEEEIQQFYNRLTRLAESSQNNFTGA